MPTPRPTILAEGKYLKLIKDGTWEYAARTRGIRAVVIVAVTENQELLLTEQFRVPLGQRVIDLPAGLVGDEPGTEGEKEIVAARRELLEETGYAAKGMKKLISGPTTAGLASELVTFYLTRNVKQVAVGGGTGSEEIQVHAVPLKSAVAWLQRKARTNCLVDVKTFFAAAWLAAQDLSGR